MRTLTTCLLLTLSFYSSAQKESAYKKFGKITVADLEKKVYAIDSSADAVVLSDIADTRIEGSSNGWFAITQRRHRVVHILNKNGYDLATVQVPLYVSGSNEEKITDLKAVTYNLVGGKIVESKMERSAVFKEKLDEHRHLNKFTLANVKEGSIIEYDLTVTSPFIEDLDAWYFQETCPTLWSEYNLMVPEFFMYSFLSRGYHPISINERENSQQSFTVRDTRGAGATESFNFSAGVTNYRWGMKDVPALKPEPFTFTRENHRSRMEFQLVAHLHPLTPKNFRTDWASFINTMLESEGFGKNLGSANGWMSDDIKPVVNGSTTEMEKAYQVFRFVRDNITSIGPRGCYMSQSLKNVLKTKKGTVADINLLLTAALRYAGIQANPVILSTTWHGYSMETSPMMRNYNYVVVQCNVDGKTVYLDASDRLLGFGRLLPHCFNGHARVINDEGRAVYFKADSVREAKSSLIILTNAEGKWSGSMSQNLGYYESYHVRDAIKEKGKEEFFKKVEKDFGMDVKIFDPHIDSLGKTDLPVKLHYNFEIAKDNASVLYINPLFGEGYRKNPFTSAERAFPVEMPYTTDETIIVNMEIPEGYVVDELPKQMVAKFDEEGKTFFEYRIAQTESNISFRCRIKIDRAFFLPEEYETLREFYNLVVKKQNEQIVLKKKS